MKSPIVFRASFEQPIGSWKMPGAIWVEIFHFKVGPPAEWRARRPGTNVLFANITPQNTPRELRNQIAGVFFEKQLTDWVAFDTTIPGRPEELRHDEWMTDSQGKVHITELRRQRQSEALIASKKAAALEGAK